MFILITCPVLMLAYQTNFTEVEKWNKLKTYENIVGIFLCSKILSMQLERFSVSSSASSENSKVL